MNSTRRPQARETNCKRILRFRSSRPDNNCHYRYCCTRRPSLRKGRSVVWKTFSTISLSASTQTKMFTTFLPNNGTIGGSLLRLNHPHSSSKVAQQTSSHY